MSHTPNILADDTPRKAINPSQDMHLLLSIQETWLGWLKYLSTQQVTPGVDLPPLLQDILCCGFLFRAVLCESAHTNQRLIPFFPSYHVFLLLWLENRPSLMTCPSGPKDIIWWGELLIKAKEAPVINNPSPQRLKGTRKISLSDIRNN